jgi:hypothetical protein
MVPDSCKEAKVDRVEIIQMRPGVRIIQKSTRKKGVIVAPPKDESVQLFYTWIDLGNGFEQIEHSDIKVVLE